MAPLAQRSARLHQMGLLALLQLSAVTDAASAAERAKTDCKHGAWDAESMACRCYDGWTTAGITDTVDFLEGVCEQYQCQSDKGCQEVLNIPGASCPVKNWNCYCGWEWAFANFGHGWETPERKGGGECMGVMYTFSVWGTRWLEFILARLWKLVLPLAAVLLPFGRKRAICDHHWPSLWNGFRKVLGFTPTCRGDCVMSDVYTLDTFKDDIAWTLYVLDVGVWLYLFLATLWIVTLLIWSVVLWVAVIAITVAVTVCGLVASCGDGLGQCDCDCSGNALESGACNECCCCPLQPVGDTAPGPNEVFYLSGYDPCWGYSTYGVSPTEEDCCCQSKCCSSCCWPVAWLLYVFPVLPENAWGGLCGYFLFGTHQHTPPERLYQSGNAFIEFLRMGWRRRADLHDNDAWRMQVYSFLTGDGDAAGQAPQAQRMWGGRRRPGQGQAAPDVRLVADGTLRRVVKVGRAHAIYVDRAFDEEGDACVPSSYRDYAANSCWICMGGAEQWDLWLSCHHLFCKDCSTEMLRRQMPCPLCRVSSSTVLRGEGLEGRKSDYPTLLPRPSSLQQKPGRPHASPLMEG